MEAHRFIRVPPRGPTFANVSDRQLLACWRSGLDTHEIAIQLSIPEYEAYNRLPRIREHARQENEWDFEKIAREGQC